MFVALYTLMAAGLGAAVTSPIAPVLQKRACGETSKLVCFGGSNGGAPQDINVDDIEYAAQYLRNIALDNEGTPGAFWTSKTLSSPALPPPPGTPTLLPGAEGSPIPPG